MFACLLVLQFSLLCGFIVHTQRFPPKPQTAHISIAKELAFVFLISPGFQGFGRKALQDVHKMRQFPHPLNTFPLNSSTVFRSLRDCYASVNSSSAHPPPGNSGAFSRTFHPGGRALGLISLPFNYPGIFDHPTFFHLTTLSFLLMTISSANTVSFFLNTSR